MKKTLFYMSIKRFW